MQRKVSFAPGEYYHIYNRGTEKRRIFMDISDHNRFWKLLFFGNSQVPINFRSVSKGVSLVDYGDKRGITLVDIGAYCLMPNHFHLLIRAKDDEGVEKFMRKLCTAYSMYFNLKYERSGKLFQGAFKSEHVDSDEYLKYLFAYIHLNPVKIIDPSWREDGSSDLSRTETFLNSYAYSSHLDYLQDREVGQILNKSAFPDYFSGNPGVNTYNSYLLDWLTMQK